MRSDYIEGEEFLSLIEYIPEPYATVALVALFTGFRVGDICRMKRENLHAWHPVWYLTIQEKKTGKSRTVAIPVSLAALMLIACPEDGKTEYLFPSKRDARKHIDRSTVYRHIRRAAEKAGLEKRITPHTARKIYAVELLRACGDIDKVRRDLNHDNVGVTMLYGLADRV